MHTIAPTANISLQQTPFNELIYRATNSSKMDDSAIQSGFTGSLDGFVPHFGLLFGLIFKALFETKIKFHIFF